MIPFQENKSKISVVLYADLCGFSRSLSDTFSSFIKEIGGHFFHRLFGYFDGNLLTGCSKNILKLSILGQKSKQVFKDFCLQVFSKMQTLKNYQFFKTCQKIGRCSFFEVYQQIGITPPPRTLQNLKTFKVSNENNSISKYVFRRANNFSAGIFLSKIKLFFTSAFP